MCCHKQQKQVLTFEESWRESKFNSSQKFYMPVLAPGGTKFFFFKLKLTVKKYKVHVLTITIQRNIKLNTISGGYGSVLWGHTQLQGHHSTSAFHKHSKSPPHTSFAMWTNETPEKNYFRERRRSQPPSPHGTCWSVFVPTRTVWFGTRIYSTVGFSPWTTATS